jgi:hypothetical protein
MSKRELKTTAHVNFEFVWENHKPNGSNLPGDISIGLVRFFSRALLDLRHVTLLRTITCGTHQSFFI